MFKTTLCAAFVALIFTAAALISVDYSHFQQAPLQLAQVSQIEVPKGQSQTALVDSWAQQGWLSNPQRDVWWLRLHNRLDPTAHSLKAGVYELRPGQSLLAALAMIRNGELLEYSFTLVEGWSFSQMRDALGQAKSLRPSTQDWNAQRIMQAIDSAQDDAALAIHPEGQFLPETYRYVAGSSDLDLLRRAHSAMQQALAQAWAKRDDSSPLTSAQEALVLASIIEKETAIEEERSLISGVFSNRLRKGMRLQTDPTVIYGLGSTFDGDLRRKDLLNDTPYNTYTRSGLPPTPICMPGAASLLAAVQPQATDKLYFVATGEGGRHQFSATLKQHNLAVRKYQLR